MTPAETKLESPDCVFCRSKDTEFWTSWGYHKIRCKSCGAIGPTADSQEEAISAWNQRHEDGK